MKKVNNMNRNEYMLGNVWLRHPMYVYESVRQFMYDTYIHIH